MQGSYKSNGLPRPYYMKPTRRRSVYGKMPRHSFLTNSRKLTGYVMMLFLFGVCIFLISQELKTPAETSYEIVGSNWNDASNKNSGDVGKFIDSEKPGDSENDKTDLALNKAQNSKGEFGHAVMEAPKGGIVNEGHIVGNDEELILDGKKKEKGIHDEEPPVHKRKGFKATRGDKNGSQKNSNNRGDSPEAEKKNTNKEGGADTESHADLLRLNEPMMKADDVNRILEESNQQ